MKSDADTIFQVPNARQGEPVGATQPIGHFISQRWCQGWDTVQLPNSVAIKANGSFKYIPGENVTQTFTITTKLPTKEWINQIREDGVVACRFDAMIGFDPTSGNQYTDEQRRVPLHDIEIVPLKQASVYDRVLFVDRAGLILGAKISLGGVTDLRFMPLTIDPFKQHLVEEAIRLIFEVNGAKERKHLRTPRPILGTDVEFTVASEDGLVYSPVSFVADTQNGAIGTDGFVETLELRVRPSRYPETIVSNMRALFKRLAAKMPPGIDIWGGGGSEYARNTGLHIHFGNTAASYGNYAAITPAEYVRALDAFLGRWINRMKGAERSDDRYGNPGDFRWKGNYGKFPHDGFEWRMPATFCVTPDFTEAIFGLAKAIVLHLDYGEELRLNMRESPKPEWFRQMKSYDSVLEDYARVFCEQRKTLNLHQAVLNNWVGHDAVKDLDGDVQVEFSDKYNNGPFIVHDPHKRFKHIGVWGFRSLNNEVRFSTLKGHKGGAFVEDHLGYDVVEQGPPKTVREMFTFGPENTVYIGLSNPLIDSLMRANNGSRHRVRMLIQQIAKRM